RFRVMRGPDPSSEADQGPVGVTRSGQGRPTTSATGRSSAAAAPVTDRGDDEQPASSITPATTTRIACLNGRDGLPRASDGFTGGYGYLSITRGTPYRPD